MKKYKLEDLCTEIIDCPHSTPNWKNEGVRVIRNFNIKNGRLDFSDGYFVDEDSYKERTRRAIPEANDLVISREAPMGAVCIIPENLKCCLGQRLVLLKIDNSICDSKYLLFSIQSDYVQKQIEVINKTGSIVSNLNISDLKKLMIPYRSLSIQQKITAVLSSLDDKIALNNRINAKLEQMAKRLYDYWFVQFDFPRSVSGEPCLHELSRTDDGNARSDFPGADGKPYKSNGGKMVWNKELKREIPEGWEVGVLSDVANITMGQSPEGSSYNECGEGIVFYQGSTDFGIRFPTVRMYTTEPTRYAKKRDILMSVRAPVGTLNIANSDCCIGRGLAALNSKLNSITHLWYMMDVFKHIFENKNGAGTTFGSITKDELYKLPVVIPTKDVIEQFNEKTLPIFNQQLLVAEENVKLTKLRDRLLPLLMNGQVVVE